jgi:hypothetical protein
MRSALLITAALGVGAVLLAALLHRSEPGFSVGTPAVRPAATLEPGQTVCRDDVDVPVAYRRARVYATGPASLEITPGSATAGARVRLCVRNDGASPVTLLGAPPDTPPDLLGEGAAQFAATLTAGESRSALAQLPDMLERAAVFKPGWIGTPLVWVLLLAVAAGLPALLAAAAYSSERSSSRSASTSSEEAPAS